MFQWYYKYQVKSPSSTIDTVEPPAVEPISGYLLLTVQRRSLKSTLPAEKGQLWVSWLAKISTFCGNKTEGFWCVDTTPGGFWCAGRIWGYTSLKNSGSWFSSLSMENASTNQSFSGGWLHLGCQGTLLLAFLPPQHHRKLFQKLSHVWFEQWPVRPGDCLYITLTYKRNTKHQTSMYH